MRHVLEAMDRRVYAMCWELCSMYLRPTRMCGTCCATPYAGGCAWPNVARFEGKITGNTVEDIIEEQKSDGQSNSNQL